MTAAVAGLALIPLVLAAGQPGKEILYPVAVVILGGLLSSTFLDMAVTPAVFSNSAAAPRRNTSSARKSIRSKKNACAVFATTSISTSTSFAAEKEQTEKKEKDGRARDGRWHHRSDPQAPRRTRRRGEVQKLADVHHHAFAIRDLANGLPGKVAADKKARVEGSVKNIAKLADDLDKTGDDNNQAGTEANLKKLDGVLKALDSQVK